MNDSFTMVDRKKNKSKNSKSFTENEVSFTPTAHSDRAEKSRNEENCMNFTLIDYSEKNEKSENPGVSEKLLRRPFTKRKIMLLNITFICKNCLFIIYYLF